MYSCPISNDSESNVSGSYFADPATLAVGKTEHGKSTQSNSILEEVYFDSRRDAYSVKSKADMFQKEIDEQTLNTTRSLNIRTTDTKEPYEATSNVSGSYFADGHDLATLAVGKTEHGKSTQSNSIIEEVCFDSRGDAYSVKSKAYMFQKEIDEQTLLVMDTPRNLNIRTTDTKEPYEATGKVSGSRLPDGFDLDILVVGKTGHGKSATANSILGEECFDSRGDPSSVTSKAAMFQKKIDGRKLLVVDTPGIFDTRITDKKKQNEAIEREFRTAIALCPEGVHAVLLVFKYGDRMTSEEQDAIKELKSLLGQNVMRDHGVLLVTRGDDFKRGTDGAESFKEWCKKQKGPFQDNLKECQYRCLLFNNRDKEVWDQQRIELIQMIDGMKSGKRYTDGIFKTVKEQWFGGRIVLRKSFLICSVIYFEIMALIINTKQYDQAFVDKMRYKLNELKIAPMDLEEDLMINLLEVIEEAESEINELEKKIESSEQGFVDKDRIRIGEKIDLIVFAILAILLSPVLLVAVLAGGVVSSVWKEMKQFKGKKCVLQ